MSGLDEKTLIQIIRSDDLEAFLRLAEDRKTLLSTRLGRFPLLSIMYMYRSRKLLKAYEKQLWSIDKYKEHDEPSVLSSDFRLIAGRSLRLYVNNEIVSPLEMLALLGKDSKVKKLYLKMPTDINIERRLSEIYTSLQGRRFGYDGNKLRLSRKVISRHEQNVLTRMLTICIGLIMLVGSVFGVYVGVLGDGWLSSAKIYNAAQLSKALKSSGRYRLMRDIVLDDWQVVEEFSGNLDGNGCSLIVTDIDAPLINNLKGSVFNLNIDVIDTKIVTTGSFAVLVDNCIGTISNVAIKYNGEVEFESDEYNNYFALIAINNSGKIENCEASITAKITSVGDGELYASGLVGSNEGEIVNCKSMGKIDSDKVDLSGCVSVNQKTGVVGNLVNNVVLCQTCTNSEWSPIVAGITTINYGLVSKSINNANLKIDANYIDETRQRVSTIGGICGINYMDISDCYNKGNLDVVSTGVIVYAGGISGDSVTSIIDDKVVSSRITSCGNSADININIVEDDVYGFVGGISGFMQGEIKRCFSSGDFGAVPTQDKYYEGGILGGCYANTAIYGDQVAILSYYITPSDNFYLSSGNVDFGVGMFWGNYNILCYNDSIAVNGIIASPTIDQLKLSGVYYEC
ncbi:MAG: hypothetical protein E7356_01645 [Clostridiales bacterium]|nr:hypothetical protein [Clostridiales bacterium]